MSLFTELKRRNVFRVGIAYALTAWVLAQAADFALDLIGAPNWILQSIVVVIGIGFPLALIFAWAFEVTPEGIKRESEVDHSQSITPQTGKKLDRLIIAVMGAVIVILLADRFYLPGETGSETFSREAAVQPEAAEAGERGPTSMRVAEPEPPVTAPAAQNSIAVLPFVNMSADAENEFFSDGVSEEILNVLARIPELKVAARTSAFAFKGSSAKIADIALELGVNHVLEGSVRKAGDQVRVTAQLIQASDGFHLWSETYDRKLDNIFAIQDEIAAAIAGELKVSLGLEKGSAGNLTGTQNLQAYEHYLQGMSLWHQRTASSLRQATQEFEQAIALDAQFAKAHAGLALTWAVLPGYDTHELDWKAVYAAGDAAATRALALDPDNAEATAALAMVRQYQDRYQESRDLLQRAIDLNPSFATAHQWYGVILETFGDPENGLVSLQRARSLDPKSRIIGYNLAWLLQGLGRLDEAVRVNEDVLRWAPDFSDIHAQTMMFATLNGDCERVRQQAESLVSMLHKNTDSTDSYVALCNAKTPEQRAPVLKTMLSWAPFDYASPANPTLTYSYQLWNTLIELGEFDAVFEGLEGSGYGLLEVGGLRSRRTHSGIRFQCEPRWLELEHKARLPAAVNPVTCP